jgi:cell division protein FtsN
MICINNIKKGTTLVGLIIGLVVGLTIATVVALVFSRAPKPNIQYDEKGNKCSSMERLDDPNNSLYAKDAPIAMIDETGEDATKNLSTTSSQTEDILPAETNGLPSETPIPANIASASNINTNAPIVDGIAVESPQRFRLQVGAFSASDKAEKIKNDLAKNGINATVEAKEKDGQTIYRVRTNLYNNKSEMEQARQKITNDLALTSKIIKE